MKKILGVILILAILAGLGYLGYKYFWPTSVNQLGGPTIEAQFCDTDSHTCAPITPDVNSGTLKITITAGGKSVNGLEVDVGTKPGAAKYYMMLTDTSGAVVFNGIPTGSYSIYFNGNNFPKQFGDPPSVPVEILISQTTQKTIDLISK